MSYPRTDFDESSIIRWSKDPMLCCQPMMDHGYSYLGQDFVSHGGYWVFNGRSYGLISDVKEAIEDYVEKLNHLVAMAADS